MQRLRDGFIGWSLAFAFYLWVVDQATVSEAAAGALVALATTLVLGRLAAVASDRARPETRLLKPFVRVPLAAVRESGHRERIFVRCLQQCRRLDSAGRPSSRAR